MKIKAQHPLNCAVLLTATVALASGATVNIKPGMNIPAEVAASPADTTFVIAPGTYRLEGPITAKNGDSFVGSTSCAPATTACPAILSGSRLLTSFERSGSYYYVAGQTQQGAVTIDSSRCQTGYAGCIYPEDLFFDGKPLIHVTALSDVAAGKWYFDYGSNTIYFYDNPSGHTVETSVVPAAFTFSSANNVTIKYLTVKEFAVPVMEGAIEGGSTGFGSTNSGANWVVEDSEILLNHGNGIHPNFGWQILNNYIHNNGNLGIGAGIGGGNSSNGSGTTTSNLLIQGNNIAYNNYAMLTDHYGSGGVKLMWSRGVVAKGNNIHDNTGSAFHMDTNNYTTLFENNTVTNNTEMGFFEEISFGATVRNNVFSGNGYIHPNDSDWLYAGAIVSSTSENVIAYCNTATVSAKGGNGIDILTQARGSGYTSSGNNFHHNTVVFQGDSGSTGAATDNNQAGFFTNNKFDYNSYHLPSEGMKVYAWADKWYTFSGFQAEGQDSHGTVDTDYTGTVPTVTISSPADQASVSGTTTLEGTAKNGTIDKVEFYVDWVLKSTVTDGTFSFGVNTSQLSAGQHVLAAMAYNTAGLHACNAITVTVP